MELFKKILDLLLYFFEGRNLQKKEDIRKHDDTQNAVVNEMKAESNAHAVQQHQKLDENLVKLEEKHKEEREDAKKSDNPDDDQFGSDW